MRKLIVVLALFVVAPLAFAASGVWGMRGIGRQLAAQGSSLYEADGRGISVYDTSSANPVRVTAVPTPEESRAVAVSGDVYLLTSQAIYRFATAANGTLVQRGVAPTTDSYDMLAAGNAYIAAAGVSALTVWSTTDGDAPLLVAQLPHSGVLRALAFHGSELWVAVQDQGIYAYDLANGGVQLGVIPVNASGIAIHGNTLYAAAGANGLIVADISNANAPAIISRTGAGEVNLAQVALAGTTVFATEGSDLIRVYDVSAPDAPREVTTINGYAQELASDGTRFFAGGSLIDEWGLPNVTPLRMSVYDAAGRQTGSFSDTLGGPVSGAATDGTFAYVVDWPNFRVLDISNPAEPKPVASITFPAMQDYVKIHNGFAIVYGRGKLNLVDIHDPWAPKFLGTYDSLGMPGGGATFAGDTPIEANPETGMHVLDFFYTTPDKPVQIGGIIWHYYDIVSLPHSVYMFDRDVMRVVDLRDTHNPHTVKSIPVAVGHAVITAAETSSPRLVVEALDRFHVFDLTDPLNPVEVGDAPLPAAVRGPIAAESDDSVLIALPGEIDRLDISNPAHPSVQKAGIMAPLAPMQIAAAGGKIVVADRYALRVYGDVTAAPVQAPARRRTTGR